MIDALRLRPAVALLALGAAAAIALRPAVAQSSDPATGATPAPASAAAEVDGFEFVRLTTSEGEIHLLLDTKAAPLTTANFLQYVDDGFYAGTVFHRVIPTFMVQGGGFTPEGDQKDVRDGVLNEWRNGLKNEKGSVAMARIGGRPNSGTAQFFINVVDNAGLDRPQRDGAAYAVFGTVVDGMDAVEAIRTVETGEGTLSGRPARDVPVDLPVIEGASRMERSELSSAAREKVADWQERYAEARATVRDRRARHAAAMKALEADGTDMESGLRYAVVESGEGPEAKPADTVVVEYTGWLPEGLMFDSSLESPAGPAIEFPLGRVIPGFRDGLSGMQVGETRVLRIPPDQAYGPRPIMGVENATLIFEVKLVELKQAAAEGG